MVYVLGKSKRAQKLKIKVTTSLDIPCLRFFFEPICPPTHRPLSNSLKSNDALQTPLSNKRGNDRTPPGQSVVHEGETKRERGYVGEDVTMLASKPKGVI